MYPDGACENLRPLIESAADEEHRDRLRRALEVIRAQSPPQPAW